MVFLIFKGEFVRSNKCVNPRNFSRNSKSYYDYIRRGAYEFQTPDEIKQKILDGDVVTAFNNQTPEFYESIYKGFTDYTFLDNENLIYYILNRHLDDLKEDRFPFILKDLMNMKPLFEKLINKLGLENNTRNVLINSFLNFYNKPQKFALESKDGENQLIVPKSVEDNFKRPKNIEILGETKTQLIVKIDSKMNSLIKGAELSDGSDHVMNIVDGKLLTLLNRYFMNLAKHFVSNDSLSMVNVYEIFEDGVNKYTYNIFSFGKFTLQKFIDILFVSIDEKQINSDSYIYNYRNLVDFENFNNRKAVEEMLNKYGLTMLVSIPEDLQKYEIINNELFGDFFKWRVEAKYRFAMDGNIIPLSRYQIYSKNDFTMFNQSRDGTMTIPCLLYAIKMANKDKENAEIIDSLIYTNADMHGVKKRLIAQVVKKLKNTTIVLKAKYPDRARIRKYGNGTNIINLGLVDEHYFAYDENIIIYDGVKIVGETNSYDIVNNYEKYAIETEKIELYNNPQLYAKMVLTERVDREDDVRACNIDENIKEDKSKIKQFKGARIFFADFETYISNGKEKPYQVAFTYVVLDKDANIIGKIHRFAITSPNCVNLFMDNIEKLYPDIVYFHNLKFDSSLFLSEAIARSKTNVGLCKKEGALYSFDITIFANKRYNKVKFVDSYKIIPDKLANFKSMFNLDVKKEWMDYRWFDNLTITNGEFDKVYVDYTGMPEEAKDVATKGNCFVNGKLDALKYSEIYCLFDCIVLQKGLLEFDRLLYQFSGIRVWPYLTISSIARQYAMTGGCFKDCYKVSGNTMQFIQHCVRGGVCGTAHDKKYYTDKEVLDRDANSLYLSVMNMTKCFPKGKVLMIPKDSLNYAALNQPHVAAWLRVSFNKVINADPFNFMSPLSYKDRSGKVIYDIVPNKIYFVTMIDINELINYGAINVNDIIFIDGYWTTEGYNDAIVSLTDKLYNERLRYKKEGNSMQIVLKLIGNSIYGFTILKPSKYKESFSCRQDKNSEYMTPVGVNNGKVVFHQKVFKNMFDHSNYAQIGTYVLSNTKLIMNRFKWAISESAKIAKAKGLMDVNCPSAFITDTDSMQYLKLLDKDMIDIFTNKFGYSPDGGKIGQSKIDYEVPKIDKKYDKVESYAYESFFIGRKIYLSRIVHKFYKDNILIEEKKTNHARHKGIPKNALENAAKCEGVELTSLRDTYDALLRNRMVSFDLCKNNVRLDIKFATGISVKTSFIRNSQVKGPFETY